MRLNFKFKTYDALGRCCCSTVVYGCFGGDALEAPAQCKRLSFIGGLHCVVEIEC